MSEKLANSRKLCLNQAQEFIDAADLLPEQTFPHIIYHLCLLALEEIGKANLLAVQAIRHGDHDDNRFESWLDNHQKKLQWAVWSPVDRIDPKDFEDARKFAVDAHERRLASLYVDPKAEITAPPPREQVLPEIAVHTRNFARTRLVMERAHGTPTGEVDDLTEWFLNIMEDPDGQRQMFSGTFRAKYEELSGDARAWATWARVEMARLEKDAREQMEAELARPASPKGASKPRWRGNAKLYTPSHSVRSKALAQWNEKISAIQLLWTGKKDSLLLQITLHDNEPLAALPMRLISLGKLVAACLSIGSLGYFWFQRPGFEQQMFTDARDLEGNKPMAIEARKSFWGTNRAVAMTTELIDHAIHCMLAFAPLPEAEAEPIFMPYFNGLALMAKSDTFYNFDELARKQFCSCLAAAMRRYGGWNGKPEEYEAKLHENFEPCMPDAEHRALVFKSLQTRADPSESSLDNLRSAKNMADLYLIRIARGTWSTILKNNDNN